VCGELIVRVTASMCVDNSVMKGGRGGGLTVGLVTFLDSALLMK
jgi:hypothetical protein